MDKPRDTTVPVIKDMDSATITKEPTGGKISVLVAKCLGSFRQLLSMDTLDQDEDRRSISLSLGDEETRFKVWSGNIGAHKKGRSSLDYRLRDASHIQKQVINLLQDLAALLDDAVAIITGEEEPWDHLEDDGLGTDDDDLDDGIPDTELGQIAVDVADVVNCLLRLSVSIRNPAPHDRFVASAPTETSYYEPFDIQHVQSKFSATINEGLAIRLGKAISRRRQYFKYREMHHAKLCQGLNPDGPAPADTASTIASSIPRELKDRESSASGSMGVVDEDARSDGGVSETSFASSIMAETAKLRVPPLPKEAERGPFECPFCFMMITATNSVSWKRHVYGDLRPYVCLHTACPTPERDFARRHEWMEHEVANHWKIYHCPGGCDDKFPTAAACKAHVRTAHPNAIPESQLDVMASLSARPLRFEDGISCRLCKETLSSRLQYQRHVGRHQEQLSLFALPIPPHVGAEGDEERSDGSDGEDDDHGGASGAGNEEDEGAPDYEVAPPPTSPGPFPDPPPPGSPSLASLVFISPPLYPRSSPDLPPVSPTLAPLVESEDHEYTKPSDLARYAGQRHGRDDELEARWVREPKGCDIDQGRPRENRHETLDRIYQQAVHTTDAELGRTTTINSTTLAEIDRRVRDLENLRSRPIIIDTATQDTSGKTWGDSFDRLRSQQTVSVTTENAVYTQLHPPDQDRRERPPKDMEVEGKPATAILKQPKPQFPEEPEPNLTREGVAPPKDKVPEVPAGARWTKISRSMVNPEALTIGEERFEVRDDFIIVLRILTKEEIQAYTAATMTLRQRRLKEFKESGEGDAGM